LSVPSLLNKPVRSTRSPWTAPCSLTTAFEPLEPRLLLTADWTFLVYLDGDNNLEPAAIADLNEMEQVASSSAVTIAVQLDRAPGYDGSNGNWTDTRRGLVAHDTNTSLISSSLTSIGEANMGDAQTLTDFITWAVAAAPAEHYALVLWDHGGGTGGICWDDTSNDHLTVAEVGQALDAAGIHLDLLGFDACLMGMMEQAYQVSDLADVIVASEQTEPWNGWPYNTILTGLAANPTQSASALGQWIVSRYGNSYGNAETLSAVSTAGVSTLATQLDAFAAAVLAENTDWAAISDAQADAPYFTDTDFRDLGAFLDAITRNAANPAIRSAAQAALAAYDDAVLANHSGSREDATGLSIYLPGQGDSISRSYIPANFAWVAESHWLLFLNALTNASSAGADQNGTIGTATPAGTLPAALTGNVGLDGSESVGGKDVDFYSFTVTAGQTLGFDIDAKESGGDLDAVLRLFDSTGQQLALNDDGTDPDSLVSSADPYLEYTFAVAGTYTIAVSGYNNISYNPWTAGSGSSGSTGHYALAIRTVGGAGDSNGTVAAAVQLGSAPVSYSAVIGNEATGAQDVDLYAIQVESAQQLTLSVTPSGGAFTPCLSLFSADGTLLAQDSGALPEIDFDFSALGAGTYYVGVSGDPNSAYDPLTGSGTVAGSTGAYVLAVAGSSVHLDFNGTLATATPIATPATLQGELGDEPAGSLDVDFYSFAIDAACRVTFDIDTPGQGTSLDSVLRLFDSSGRELARNDDAQPGSLDPLLTYDFTAPGAYVIAVSGYANTAYNPLVALSGISGDTGAYSLVITRSGPDLTAAINSAKLPAAVRPGDRKTGRISKVPVLITNTGDTEARGTVTVNLYASADQSLDPGSDTLLGTATLSLKLKPGKTKTCTLKKITVPLLPEGSYYLLADVAPLTALFEISETNNTASTASAITWLGPGRDLTGSFAITTLPAWLRPGDSKYDRLRNIALTLTNQGDAEAYGKITITLYASKDTRLDKATDAALGSITFSVSLAPGASKTVKFPTLTVPSLTAGDYYLLADLDSANALAEAIETNNSAATTATIEWQTLGRTGIPRSVSEQ